MKVSYWDVANSGFLWLLVGLGLAFITVLAVVFLVKAWKHGLALGIQKSTLNRVVKSTIAFTVVPSISMLIGLITLASVLGAPLSWFRLSVVGSTAYELMAADMISSGLGYKTLIDARGAGGEVMGAVMLVMAIGIIGGIVVNIFASKKITQSMTRYSSGSGGWGAIFAASFMVALMGVFLPLQISKGLPAILTGVTSLVITLVLALLAKKLRQDWLGEFTLAFSLVGGMASALLWVSLFPVA